MSVMVSFPQSPSLHRSQSPASPSPRRIRSTTAQPCSKPSALSMSNLHVNASPTPGLLSLSRPSPNGRARGKKAGGDKCETQPSSRSSKGKGPNGDESTASKPSQTDASSQAIPQPTLPQLPTPVKQRSRTRRHKRSNSDPLFPSTTDENGDEPTPSNPPRTPGPSTSTPSGNASPPASATADRVNASAVPNTPTPASKSARARGGRRANQGKSSTVEPTAIPDGHAPPEADPSEPLSHSAPSESSFMLVPEPAVVAGTNGDGKRARGRGGKGGARQKETTNGSGRDEPFVLDEEEGKVWDMPEKKGNDQLTWQQSALSSSNPQFPSVASPTNNRRSSPNPRTARAPLPAGLGPATTASQHRHTASLTWQQALLPAIPSSGSSNMSNSAPSTVRRRNSLSVPTGSHDRSASSRAEQAHRQQSMMVATPMATPTKTTAIMPKEDAPVVGGRAGPRYAGPMFHNSPMAGDIPKPRFGGRM